jgi:hypothetical protein
VWVSVAGKGREHPVGMLGEGAGKKVAGLDDPPIRPHRQPFASKAANDS